MKIQSKVFREIIFNFKGILFKNQDIISGEELVECDIVSKDTRNILNSLKKLRKLNNIYYVWDYNKEFKKLIYSYKYNHRRVMAKLIAELVKEEFYYVLKREKIDVVVSVPVSRKRKNERGYNQVDEILNFLKVNYVQLERVKNTKKMAEILNGLELALDVSIYAKPEFNGRQVAEIRDGLDNELDVSIYAKPEFDWEQMYEIREGLEQGLDVSVYAKPEISGIEMEKIREQLSKESTLK